YLSSFQTDPKLIKNKMQFIFKLEAVLAFIIMGVPSCLKAVV
ncbi:hypothetical protein HMPREF9103_02328, partial [Lentilactobacillus parafarraginis F0439]